MFFSRSRWMALPVTLMIVILLIVHITPAWAAPSQQDQPTPGAPLVVDDVIQSISGTTWVVGERTVIVTSQTVIGGVPSIGKKAHLILMADSAGHWIAQSATIIIIIVPPTLTPIPTATFTPTPNITATPSAIVTPSITPGGPTLTATASSTLTITPGGPTLTPTLTLPVTYTATASSTPIPYVTIVIEGPIEKIDLTIDIVQIYGQRIKLKHDDPLRVKLKIGNWLRINGDYGVDVDQQIVIIENVIVIIDAPTVILIAPSGNGNNGGDNGDGNDKKKHDKKDD